ncbi:restriction endonuclease subunit S [Acidithiobacillus ferriphilus]|uniref:restriction endonuclease subunit S n=1 Tax=Acidithiobacillus ferriphilus TaxID=1689834 RepID=UPI00390CC123
MNPKTPSTVLTAETKPARVPKLRFPEFRGTEGWAPAALGEKSSILKGKGISKADLDPDGSQACIRYGELYTRYGETIREAVSRTKVPASELFLSKPDDVIIPSSGETKIDIAKASCVLAGGIALGGDLNVIRSKLNGTFLSYYLNGPKRLDIAKVAQGDTVVHLYPHQLEALRIAVPLPAEQQKIAECLSSVDELMAAQARKVDALKAHKKGLMQQLFPREGETQPRLRFPEFQNAGEWVVKLLGEIFPITSSKRVHESDWTATGVPFYRAREIVALNKHEPIQPLSISEELYAAHSKQTGEIRDGHLLVTGVGSIGVPYLVRAGNRFYFKDGNIIWLKNDGKELSGEFLLRLYETDYVQKQLKAMADVGTVATYTIDNAKRTLAAFPRAKAEQQRIASCLSSLDTLITSETQKLEALKTHKKGLMQQLFPVLNEVQG